MMQKTPQNPNTLQELLPWVEACPELSLILAEVKKHGLAEDAAHDLSHLFRVALWAMKLGGAQVNAKEAVAAALLHDFVNLPKNHPDRAKASTLSAEAALPILKRAGFSADAISRITAAIRDHSFSRGAVPEGPLGKALQDADRLEALGAIGTMRVFSTGARMGASYFHTGDPWARSRPLDDLRFSIDHFFTKLLKLPESFQTEEGKREARRRAAWMESFLSQTAEELGEPRP